VAFVDLAANESFEALRNRDLHVVTLYSVYSRRRRTGSNGRRLERVYLYAVLTRTVGRSADALPGSVTTVTHHDTRSANIGLIVMARRAGR
jgi:hypothetical protein